jgi:predicted MFS family arabinose efflux permease
MMAFRGGMPLGSLVGGWLTNQFTAPPVLMMNGTILALAATWFLVKGHAVREL